MADAQVNVQVSGNGDAGELRQRLQEQVEANRIALNLRYQAKVAAAEALKSLRG
jgi:hypothetical protein